MDGVTLFDIEVSPDQAADRGGLAADSRSGGSARVSDAEYAMLMGTIGSACVSESSVSFAEVEVVEEIEAAEASVDAELSDDEAEPVAEVEDADVDADDAEPSEPEPMVSSAVLADGEMGAELDRAKVVGLILSINKTVAAEYLDQFKDQSLRNYLAHLETMSQPRGRGSRWERRGDSPALMVHESAL